MPKSSHFIRIDSQKLHFYKLGHGPAIVLLHPSPHNGLLMMPIARLLASDYTVFAVDTPGYGHSDTLIDPPSSLTDYTDFLHKAFQGMGLQRPLIYGTATGAQLAIRYALEHPNFVSHVFLDNAAHFEEDMYQAIIKDYFPDLTPKPSGDHLDQIWTIATRVFQYFPWCFTDTDYFLNRPQPPLSVLHFVAMDFLRTGKDYGLAYKAAFAHERGSHVQQLKVPATIFRWENSIILPYIDALLAFDLPDHVESFFVEGSNEERLATMTDFIKGKKNLSDTYQMSEAIMEFPIPQKPDYHKPDSQAPELSNGGQHLKTAWEALVKANPRLAPDEVQHCLIDWYT